MRAERTILLLVVIVVILSIILFTGVGYAVETDSTLKISDNSLLVAEKSDFKIEFVGNPQYSGKGEIVLKLTGPTTATMNIEELNNVGDLAIARYTIANNSEYISADIDTKITNTNTEYFNVTSTVSKSVIEPKTGRTTITIMVELIKLPISNNETADIGINILAKPKSYN